MQSVERERKKENTTLSDAHNDKVHTYVYIFFHSSHFYSKTN